jgi:two-component system phosphate regulon sensor histidine kinase PhoR
MKQTILGRMVVLTLIAVVISSVVSVVVVYGLHLDNIGAELIEDGDFIVDLLNETYTLEGFVASEAIQNSSTRITVVAPDGIVIYDNQANPATMENHGNRAEIIAALEQGEAQSRRLSNTLGIHTFYYAVLLEDGNVMRFAKETDSFLFTLYRMLSMILMIIVGVILIALWLGDKMANAIITPINNLDLDDPLGNDGCCKIDCVNS